mgnify:CR=1 FL=1
MAGEQNALRQKALRFVNAGTSGLAAVLFLQPDEERLMKRPGPLVIAVAFLLAAAAHGGFAQAAQQSTLPRNGSLSTMYVAIIGPPSDAGIDLPRGGDYVVYVWSEEPFAVTIQAPDGEPTDFTVEKPEGVLAAVSPNRAGRLELRFSPVEKQAQVAFIVYPAARLTAGEGYEGSLEDSRVFAGDQVLRQRAFVLPSAPRGYEIHLGSTDFDAILVGGSARQAVSEDDDGGPGTDSRLLIGSVGGEDLALLVTSYGGDSEGAFRIEPIIRSGGRPEGTQTITQNASVVGTLGVVGPRYDNRTVAPYAFDGRAGDEVLIALRSEEFDTYLMVEAPTGVVYSDDDGGTGRNSALRLDLPVSGTYYLYVSSFSGGSSGAFSLELVTSEGSALSDVGRGPAAVADEAEAAESLPRLESGAPAMFGDLPVTTAAGLFPDAIPVRIEGGQGRASAVVGEGHAAFRFQGTEDSEVEIEVVVTSILQGTRYSDDDSMLFLFDGEGLLIGEDDDSGAGYASLLRTELPATGRYFAVVTTYNNEPELSDRGYLVEFPDNGGSRIEFDLVIELR